MPNIFIVQGNIPSFGWSGIDEIYLVPNNFCEEYFLVQRQETAEHEIMHAYNRKTHKDLNYSTPDKNKNRKKFIDKNI